MNFVGKLDGSRKYQCAWGNLDPNEHEWYVLTDKWILANMYRTPMIQHLDSQKLNWTDCPRNEYSQERAVSGSFQQNLASVRNGVSIWRLTMGWIPAYGNHWMVHPFVTAPNFVSVTPSMGVLFPFLRKGKVSTLWSSMTFNGLQYPLWRQDFVGYSKAPMLSLNWMIFVGLLLSQVEWSEKTSGNKYNWFWQ
jgi:hypothetical protein